MKTIKVFLASSEELKDEREKFGNFIRRLDDIYLKRGIHVQLFVWEDMDPCYNNVRKQNEYNARIRESQIFVALFYTRAGEYTLEEVTVARKENSRRREPKLMICCRTLQPGEVEAEELAEFKRTMEREFGHFWDNYATTDKLHLDFVMFFLNSEEGRTGALKVENGQVMLDGFAVAEMDNLPFAAGNEGYQRMKAELEALPSKIEKARRRVEKYPDEEEFRDEHQALLDRYNALKEEFAGHQQALFDTARRISEMQLEKVSAELRRAIGEFEAGRVEAANAILDGIELAAERHVEQMDRDRALVHQDIEALQLKTKTIMADASKPIEERIAEAEATFRKADDWAERSALPKEKYAPLLDEYARFLEKYAKYELALQIRVRESRMNEELYGTEHPDTAASYNNIGLVYSNLGDYDTALEYYLKALAVQENVLGTEHPDTAISYNNIGLVYDSQGDYDKALEYFLKALAIKEKVLGTEHPGTATSYNNIGLVYAHQGNYDKALEYLFKALTIREIVLGAEHPDTAISYNNIGSIYAEKGDYDKALEYYLKALTILEVKLGAEHPYTKVVKGKIDFIKSAK